MYWILGRAAHAHRHVQHFSWVDDAVYRQEGTLRLVVQGLVAAGCTFAAACGEAKFDVAAKSVVVASSIGLARDIAAALGAAGYAITPVHVGADLGTERGSGTARRKPKAMQRTQLAKKRWKKIGRFAKLSWRHRRLASKLGLAGPMPQQLYAANVVGMTPTELREVRRSLGRLHAPQCRKAA